MKLLIIISGLYFGEEHKNNIQILDNYMKQTGIDFEYCGISSHDDFHIFEDIIQFKYKTINNQRQLSKICDFITCYKQHLDYDWYIKTRPDIKLLGNIPFDMLSNDAINARMRVYHGPKKIKYGNSVNGEGIYKVYNDSLYVDTEKCSVLDDMFYIFHKNIIEKGAFETLPDDNSRQDEWFHSSIFNNRNIKTNIIGIYLCNTKHGVYSGDTNM